eukprot:3813365-Rhodomonas_salina.1
MELGQFCCSGLVPTAGYTTTRKCQHGSVGAGAGARVRDPSHAACEEDAERPPRVDGHPTR